MGFVGEEFKQDTMGMACSALQCWVPSWGSPSRLVVGVIRRLPDSSDWHLMSAGGWGPEFLSMWFSTRAPWVFLTT